MCVCINFDESESQVNEPVFPNPRWEGWGEPQQGMTLRDYFAAKAMQGSLASDDDINYPDKFAEWCYEIADAMLKERIK